MLPLSVWKMTRSAGSSHQIAPAPPRAATAISMAARARSASGRCEVAAPNRRRLNRSITVARYNLPHSVGISVISPTHMRLGSSAVKSRLTRSGNFGALLSCLVSPLRRLICRATSDWRRIDSATVFSATFQPASTRSACSRGEPCNPLACSNATFTAASSSRRRRSVSVCTPAGSSARAIHL